MVENRNIFNLDKNTKQQIQNIIINIHKNCIGQIQSRYVYRIGLEKTQYLEEVITYFSSHKEPIVIRKLPKFNNIEHSKILVLFIGEQIGKCVAYSDYNQSYITDIRVTNLSKKASSGADTLLMHSDLSFASDTCRPQTLVLSPHISEGDVPKTFLAPGKEILDQLTEDEISILTEKIYEMRVGSKLLWPNQEVRFLSVIENTKNKPIIKLNFDNIQPQISLDNVKKQKAENVLKKTIQIALQLGEKHGHVLQKGEALLIPNDFCLHGRAAFSKDYSNRLLLRSYVIDKATIKKYHYNNTMISLRN